MTCQTKKQPVKISDQEEPEQEEQPKYTKQDTPTKIHPAENHMHLRHKSVQRNRLTTNNLTQSHAFLAMHAFQLTR